MEEGNCTHICQEQNLACNFLMKMNGSFIADAAGISCEDYTDHEHDYEPAIDEDGNCLGFDKVPVEFNCDVNSPAGQKRLCDCVSSGKAFKRILFCVFDRLKLFSLGLLIM